jgi:branched-chain amino acid transport system substrate-binding protein
MKNFKTKSQLIIVLSAFLFYSCQISKNEIEIGAISELTGPIAPFGVRAMNGINLGVDYINKNGGINGKKIRLIIEDDRSIPQQAVSAMKKLVESNKVQVVVGIVGSGLGMAVAPIANSKEVVLIACGVSTPLYSTPNDYTFRIRGNATREIEICAMIAYTDYKVKNLAVVHVQNDFGVSYKNVFTNKFEGLGGKVQIVESFQSGEVNMKSIILKIKKAGIKNIFLVGQGAENGYFLKQSKEFGLNAKFFSTVGMEVPEALSIAGNAADGIIYTTTGFDPEDTDSLVMLFRSSYKEVYKEDPDLFAAEGFDAIRIASQSIKESGCDAENIKKFLYKLKDFDGVTGKISFDINGDPLTRKIFVKTIENQKYKIINKKAGL